MVGEEATPLRHHEFLIESALVCAVGAMAVGVSWFADRRRRTLESLLVMCSWCQSVGDAGRWMSIDAFLKERSAIAATYGLCPECYTREASQRKPDGERD